MSLRNTLFTFCLFLNLLGFTQGNKEVSMAKLNRELENPLSKYWSLIMQENLNLNNGDAINGIQVSNVFYLQPSLPVSVFKSRVLLIRPVFPFNPSRTRIYSIQFQYLGQPWDRKQPNPLERLF